MKKEIIIISLFGILIFFAFGFLAQLFDNYIRLEAQPLDSEGYTHAALNLFYSFKADPDRILGYPILIGIPLIFTSNLNSILHWSIFLNLVAWILTSIFIFRTLILFTGKNFSLLIAIAFLLCVGSLEYVYFMITETIYTCVITCVVYFIALYFAKNKVYFLAWAFVLFSYSLIIRPTLWPVYPFTIVILLYVAIKNRAVISNNIIVKYLIISSIGIVIVCFQLGMMKKDFGIYTMTFNGTQTFYGYLGAYAQSLKSNQTLQEVRKVRAHEITYLFNNHQWKKIDSLCNADLRDQVKNNTRNLFKGLETDIISNTFMPGNFIISNIRGWFFFDKLKNGCLWLSYWQNVLFTGFIAISVGFIIFLRKRIEKKAAIIMLLNWIFASLIICISGISYWQNNRFNIVCTPFALISFALILSSFRKKGITI